MRKIACRRSTRPPRPASRIRPQASELINVDPRFVLSDDGQLLRGGPKTRRLTMGVKNARARASMKRSNAGFSRNFAVRQRCAGVRCASVLCDTGRERVGCQVGSLRHNINNINYLTEELAFTRQHSRLNGMRLVATNREGIRHQHLTARGRVAYAVALTSTSVPYAEPAGVWAQLGAIVAWQRLPEHRSRRPLLGVGGHGFGAEGRVIFLPVPNQPAAAAVMNIFNSEARPAQSLAQMA